MQHIGKNIFSLLVSRVISGVILFLIYTRLISYFGPEVAGQYGLIAGFLTVFNFFVDLGMQQLVIKKVSENKAEAGKYLTNYFGIQFLLGLGFMLLMDAFVLLGDYPQIVKHALYVTSFSLLVYSLSMPFMAIINGFQRLGEIAKVNFFNSVINATMMALTIIFHKNIFFLSFVNLLVATFDFFVYWYIVEKNFTRFRLNFDFPFWKTLFALNVPFTLLTFFSIYNRIDTLLLPHLRSFTENGYYTAVYKFWDTLAFLPAVVSASLLPFFSESLSRGDRDNVRRGLTTYTRYMIALAMPMIAGAYVLANELTIAFFGPDFAPAAPALWLLVAAVSVLFIYSPVNALIVSQRTKSAMKITGFNLVFNLILNIVLISKFGFVAAAVVTLLSETVQWIGYTYVVNRDIISFRYWGDFVRPMAAAAIMGGVIYFLPDINLWAQVALGAVVYLLGLVCTGFFRPEDRRLLLGGLRVNPAPIERDVV